MKKILGLVAMALLLGGPAFAANTSVVNYTVEIGGDNHSALYEGSGSATPQFSPGGTSLLTLAPGVDVVTWDVMVDVTGTVDVGTSVDLPVAGAANLVWTLELYKPDGTLAAIGAAPMACGTGGPIGDITCKNAQPTAAGFFSTINDGDSDGARGVTGADAYALAAFTYAFQSNGSGSVYGRLFDAPTVNGPCLARKQYPSAGATGTNPVFPPGSTAPAGKLVGMGAGYESFYPAFASPPPVVAGVGLASSGCVALGVLPVAEGQISLQGLTDSGTYTLKIVPGQGNNVLAVSDCQDGTSGRFALAASSVTTSNGGQVQFVYNPVVVQPPPVAQSAVSRKMHSTVAYDIPLPLTGTKAGIECRSGGPTQIIVTYDVNIAGTPAITLSAGTLGTVSMATNQLTINLSGVRNGFAAPYDATCVTVTINGVANAAGGAVAAAHTVKVGALFADVNGDGTISPTDIGFVKFNSNKPVTSANFKYDLNFSNDITPTDIGYVKFMSNKSTLSCPLP